MSEDKTKAAKALQGVKGMNDMLPADADGNRANAPTRHLASKGVVVASDDPAHLVSVVGLENVIVVRTKDATLVCRADMAEKVKEIAGAVPPELQ